MYVGRHVSHYLERYKHRCDSLLFKLEIKELQKPVGVSNFISLHFYLLWLFYSIFAVNPPNWQGFFMSQITNEHYDCTTVL